MIWQRAKDYYHELMNRFTKNSINLASSGNYLDKLMDIYPVSLNFLRPVNSSQIKAVKKAFAAKNSKKLIAILLNLDRFPFDESYVGFFRKDKKSLDRNPKTVKRIGKKLFKVGLKEILAGAERPKASSRQMGQAFRKWLYRLGYPVLSKNDFLNYKKVAILKGGDSVLKEFAKEHLGYRGQKGLDLVLRVGSKFFIGEVKFITRGGGTQDKSFREAMSFIQQKDRNTRRIALLDGVVWLISPKTLKGKKKPSLYESVLKLKNDELVFSALFLKEFTHSNEKNLRRDELVGK